MVGALEDMVDDILCRPMTSIGAMDALIERSTGRGRFGTTALLAALEPWRSGLQPGSPAKVRLLRRIVAWGFPTPISQHPVADRGGHVFAYLDLAWPGRLATLEYDGRRWHGPRRAEADDAGDARLRALGWTIEHVDGHDMRSGGLRLRRLLTSWFSNAAA